MERLNTVDDLDTGLEEKIPVVPFDEDFDEEEEEEDEDSDEDEDEE